MSRPAANKAAGLCASPIFPAFTQEGKEEKEEKEEKKVDEYPGGGVGARGGDCPCLTQPS